MKKKVILTILTIFALLAFTACGGNDENDNVQSLDGFVQAFESAGYNLVHTETPFYSMIGGINGIGFQIDGENAWIYEFADAQTAQNTANSFGWLSNGRFAIETNDNNISQLFANTN